MPKLSRDKVKAKQLKAISSRVVVKNYARFFDKKGKDFMQERVSSVDNQIKEALKDPKNQMFIDQVTEFLAQDSSEFKKADFGFHLFIVQYNLEVIKLMAQAHMIIFKQLEHDIKAVNDFVPEC